MRILQLVHDYLPEHVGGAEVHTAQLSAELARRGHELTILCTERDPSAPPGSLREREHEGLRILELVHPREWSELRESWEEPLARTVLPRLLRELAADVVHVQHSFFWGVAALEEARAAGVAGLLTLHDYHPWCARATLLDDEGRLCEPSAASDCTHCLAALLPPDRPREPAALRGAHAERTRRYRLGLAAAERVIAPSRTLHDLLRREGWVVPERLVRLDLGYPGPLHPARRRPLPSLLRVGYLGGLFPAKGVHLLIEAMAELAGEPLELHLHGPLEWFPDYVVELRRRAQGLPVRFHGRYAQAQVDRLLAELDLLVLPSLWPENRPIVISEARRNGLCVLATDLGGMRELIRHEQDGLLFPRGDARALAGCLRRLARDRLLLSRLAAARPALLSMQESAGAHEALYAAARSGARSPR